jgi:hypothetical protein
MSDGILSLANKTSDGGKSLAGEYSRQLQQLFQDYSDSYDSRDSEAQKVFKDEVARLKGLRDAAANQGVVTGRDIFYPEKGLGKPRADQFAAAAGVSMNEAFDAMRSGLGDIDSRDWSKIMSSADPYTAAMQAKQAQLNSVDPGLVTGAQEQLIGQADYDAGAGMDYLLGLDALTAGYLKDKNSVSPAQLRSAKKIQQYNPETGNMDLDVYYKDPNTTTPYIDEQRFIFENQPYRFPSGEFDPSTLENLPNYRSDFQSVMGRAPGVQDFSNYGYTDPQASFEGIYGDPMGQGQVQAQAPAFSYMGTRGVRPVIPSREGIMSALSRMGVV